MQLSGKLCGPFWWCGMQYIVLTFGIQLRGALRKGFVTMINNTYGFYNIQSIKKDEKCVAFSIMQWAEFIVTVTNISEKLVL